jgi:hypothetical protein
LPPAHFIASADLHAPTSVRLQWQDVDTMENGVPLNGYKIHLNRGSTCIAEIGSGIQTFTDTGLAIPQFYKYYINTIIPGDSSLADSTTVYVSEVVAGYREDFEHGDGSLYRTGTWDTTSALASGGSGYSFTDSPGGNYPLNSESYFLLPKIKLTGQLILRFDQIAIIEDPSFGWVDISTDQGNSFSPLHSYCSSFDERWQDRRADPSDWASEIVDLSPYAGDTVVIRFRLKTANNIQCDGWYIDNIKIDRADSLTTFTHTFTPGWNLVSLPLAPVDGRVQKLFPDAISHAFAYRSTYTVEDSLSVGSGYWVKYGESAAVEMTGRNIPRDTIQLNARWNLVGVASTAINPYAITTVPAGILLTGFYTYNGSSYVLATTLQPGKGYWVKASQAGMIILSTIPSVVSNSVERNKSYIRLHK